MKLTSNKGVVKFPLVTDMKCNRGSMLSVLCIRALDPFLAARCFVAIMNTPLRIQAFMTVQGKIIGF